ncbi:hypothetical protein Tco_1075948 [Tanacetum coccineum]
MNQVRFRPLPFRVPPPPVNKATSQEWAEGVVGAGGMQDLRDSCSKSKFFSVLFSSYLPHGWSGSYMGAAAMERFYFLPNVQLISNELNESTPASHGNFNIQEERGKNVNEPNVRRRRMGTGQEVSRERGAHRERVAEVEIERRGGGCGQ